MKGGPFISNHPVQTTSYFEIFKYIASKAQKIKFTNDSHYLQKILANTLVQASFVKYDLSVYVMSTPYP